MFFILLVLVGIVAASFILKSRLSQTAKVLTMSMVLILLGTFFYCVTTLISSN